MDWLKFVTDLLGGLFGFGLGIGQNELNERLTRETNETNYRIARETNQANIEQANLAYQRSLPLNQVNHLMGAGLSRQGALSMLSGAGSYTAPTLQSSTAQAPQKDFSAMQAAIQRLESIPSNIQQYQNIEEQREALRVDTQNKVNADLRAQEAHDFDMWQKLYGKEATIKLDNLSNKIVQEAASKNISLDNIDTLDKLIKTFDLGSDPDFRTMPRYARQQIFDAVKAQAEENRAKERQQFERNEEERRKTAADDSHKMSEQQLKLIKLHIKDYNDEKDARIKEYKAREVAADMRKLADSYDYELNKESLSSLFRIDPDGNLEIKEDDGKWYKISSKEQFKRVAKWKDYWSRIAEIMPINVLGRAISLMIK